MRVCYIGYGEAGYNITKGWKAEGLTDIAAYDANRDHPTKGELIRRRASEVGVALSDTVEEAVKGADYIFNNTSAAFALEIAKTVLPLLTAGQIYLDLNATSPETKQRMAAVPHTDGVYFCDIGVMGGINEKAHQTKMYVSGDAEGVKRFCETFARYGMDLHPLDAPAGGASAIKMFKSVFSKGLPQLLFESMLPAAQFGVLDEYMKNIDNTFKGRTVSEFADKILSRTIVNSERRSHELAEVVATLESMNMDADMARGTMNRLKKAVETGLSEAIPADEVLNYHDTIELALKYLGGDAQKRDA